MIILKILVVDGRLHQTGGNQTFPRPTTYFPQFQVVMHRLHLSVWLIRVYQLQFFTVVRDITVFFDDLIVGAFARTVQIAETALLSLQELMVPQDRFLRHGGQVGRRVEIFEGEVDYFVGFHPLAVDAIETFQVDYLQEECRGLEK